MNVNERIVNCWLNNCRDMLTMSNIIYSNFNAAIDLLAVDLRGETPLVWDIEVKLRSGGMTIAMNDTNQRGYHHFRDQLLDENRDRCVREIISPACRVQKIFITNRNFLHNQDKSNEAWEATFAADGITVLYFEDIIAGLREKATYLKTSDDEILQVLRLLDALDIQNA